MAPGHDPGLQRHHLLPRALVSRRCFAALVAERIGQIEAGWTPAFDFTEIDAIADAPWPAAEG